MDSGGLRFSSSFELKPRREEGKALSVYALWFPLLWKEAVNGVATGLPLA